MIRTEVLGLPGAGKSTVVAEIARTGVPTVSEWRVPTKGRLKTVTVLALVLQAPVLAAAAFFAVVTRRGCHRIHVRRIASVLRRHVRVRKLRGTVVLDEGPVHALFITLYGTRSTTASRLCLRLVLALLSRHVERYIFLDTPPGQCVQNFRRSGRTSVRFNGASPEWAVADFLDDRTYAEIIAGLGVVAGAKLQIVAVAAEIPTLIRAQAASVAAATRDSEARRRCIP